MAILDVVKNEGERGLTAWKYPQAELASGSQLLVGAGEAAVLFTCDGVADCFGSGRHTLKTPNLPFLGPLIRLPFGGKPLFAAELWYVKVNEILDIKWGTDTPIQPAYGGSQPLRGYGSLGIRITDPGLFISSMRGRVDSFDPSALAVYFRGQLSHSIRQAVTSCYSETGAEFFEKAGVSALLAAELARQVTPILAGYGMKPVGFTVGDLSTAPQVDGERHLTLSVRSVITSPPAGRPQRYSGAVRSQPSGRPVTAAALILLVLVLLVFCLLLPPRQTADFAGIALVTAAHCLVTALLLWLGGAGRGLLVTVGFTVVAALYWLGGVGVALAFRLLSIADTRLLVALELGLVCVAALALMGFWYGSAYDTTEVPDKEVTNHGEEDTTGDE